MQATTDDKREFPFKMGFVQWLKIMVAFVVPVFTLAAILVSVGSFREKIAQNAKDIAEVRSDIKALDAKIDKLETKLETKIEKLDDKVDAHHSAIQKALGRIEGLLNKRATSE